MPGACPIPWASWTVWIVQVAFFTLGIATFVVMLIAQIRLRRSLERDRKRFDAELRAHMDAATAAIVTGRPPGPPV